MTRFANILFNLIALFIVVYLGVDIFYRFVDVRLLPVKSLETAAGSVPGRSKEKRPPLAHYGKISERGLLGGPAKGGAEKEKEEMGAEQIAALKPTTLSIVLLGTVSGPERVAFAVMEEKGKKKQGLYQTGDKIQGAVVKKVLRGKVILEVGGKDEILEMEQAKTGKKGGRGLTSGNGADETITVAHDDLQKSLGNINSLLTQVRIRPLIKNGKPDGLILSSIKAGSIFSKLGLKNGDVVKKIDNQLIRSPDDAFAFYNRLKSGAELSLEIARGSETRTVHYRFR